MWVLSSGLKRLGREADHSLPSGAKVKHGWSYTSTPPIYFQGADRDNFTCKSRITMAKAAFNQKTLFISKRLKCKGKTSKVLHLDYSFIES
jgi:hypothetical protein